MPTAPLGYPLDPLSVAGTTLTVDQALNQPTVITRDIARLAMQNFFADRIFTVGGDVSGGAVLFERPPSTQTDLFAERDVQEVAPGEEFPLLAFARGEPLVARPRKIGGKWFVTREERRRNDTRLLANYIRVSANTIRRKVEQMAIAELNAVITAESRTFAGSSWATPVSTTAANQTAAMSPLSNLIEAREVIDLEERGHDLSGLILHPSQWSELLKIFGTSQGARDALRSVGITEVFVSARHPAGQATLYEPNGVGGWRNEFPLTQETEDEGPAAGGRQRTWYQFSVSPVIWVDDQFALLRITGIA